jgi:16S rRNA G966 N2-methylase RsmD
MIINNDNSLSKRLYIIKYGAIAIIGTIAFGLILIILLTIFMALNLNLNEYALTAVVVGIPVSIPLAISSKSLRRQLETKLFYFFVQPIISENINNYSKLIEKESSQFKDVMQGLSYVFSIFSIVSNVLELDEVDKKVGEGIYKLIEDVRGDFQPDVLKQELFRHPFVVTKKQFKMDNMKQTFKDHPYLNMVTGNRNEEVGTYWMFYCLFVFMRDVQGFNSNEIYNSTTDILYFLSLIKNYPLKFEESNLSAQFEYFVRTASLTILYLFYLEGGNIITYMRREISKDFLVWLSMIDLVSRSSYLSPLKGATQYFFEEFTKGGKKTLTLAKEFAELLSVEEIDQPLAINALKAFAKMNIKNESKAEFIKALMEELNQSENVSKKYLELSRNILLYLSIVINFISGADYKNIEQNIGMKVNVTPSKDDTCNVSFFSQNGNLIAQTPNTLLLFDRNSLETARKLTQIEQITEKSLSEIIIDLGERKKLKILTWPFGATESETMFMGIWPPTIDTYLFMRVLSKLGYYESSIKSVVDIGAGSGILGLSFQIFGNGVDVVFTDVNNNSELWIKANAAANELDPNHIKFHLSRSNDFIRMLKDNKQFDLALLSPPYLPQFMIHGNHNIFNKIRSKHNIILEEISIETIDTGLLYDVLLNFKMYSTKLIVLYSSIIDDVVEEAKAEAQNIKENVLFERKVPLKIKGLVPLNEQELNNWPDKERKLLLDLKKRGRLFDPPENSEDAYPFWHKLKIVEFS